MSLASGGALVVVGAAGGCGTTTLALSLALAAARAGRHARIVDLVPGGGDLSGALAVPADRSLGDLRPVLDELTDDQLTSVAFPHRSGIEVLVAHPSDPISWHPDDAERLVRANARSATTIVDAGAGPTPSAIAAALAAGRVVVALPPTLAGARRASRLRAALGEADVRGVIGPSVGQRELGRRALERASGIGVSGALPHAPDEADGLGAGRWPSGRRSRLARALQQLADEALA